MRRLVWQELDGDTLAEHRTRLAELAQQLMNKDQMVSLAAQQGPPPSAAPKLGAPNTVAACVS